MHFLERKLILVPLQFQFFVCFTCIYKRGTGNDFFSIQNKSHLKILRHLNG